MARTAATQRRVAARSLKSRSSVAAVVQAQPVAPFVASPAQKRILNKRARGSLAKASHDLGVAAAATPSKHVASQRRAAYTPRRAAAAAYLPTFRRKVGREYIVVGRQISKQDLSRDIDAIRRDANMQIQRLRSERDRVIQHRRAHSKRAWQSYKSGKKKHVKGQEEAYRSIKHLRVYRPRG